MYNYHISKYKITDQDFINISVLKDECRKSQSIMKKSKPIMTDAMVQTIFTVSPHFMSREDQAVVKNDQDTQTTITFKPRQSESKLFPILTSYLNHERKISDRARSGMGQMHNLNRHGHHHGHIQAHAAK